MVVALDTVIRARRHDIRAKCKQWLGRFPKARDDFARRSRKRRGSVDSAMLQAAAAASERGEKPRLQGLPHAVPTLAPGQRTMTDAGSATSQSRLESSATSAALSADELGAQWVDDDDHGSEDDDRDVTDDGHPDADMADDGAESRHSDGVFGSSSESRGRAAQGNEPSQGGASPSPPAAEEQQVGSSASSGTGDDARASPPAPEQAAMDAMRGDTPWDSIPTLSILGLQLPTAVLPVPMTAGGHRRGGSGGLGGYGPPSLIRARSQLAIAPSDRQHMPQGLRGMGAPRRDRVGMVYGGTRGHAAMLDQRPSSEGGSEAEGDDAVDEAPVGVPRPSPAYKPAATLAGGELEEHARAARAIATAAATGRGLTPAEVKTSGAAAPPSRRGVMDVFSSRGSGEASPHDGGEA